MSFFAVHEPVVDFGWGRGLTQAGAAGDSVALYIVTEGGAIVYFEAITDQQYLGLRLRHAFASRFCDFIIIQPISLISHRFGAMQPGSRVRQKCL